jgi:hypothetical protein
VANSADDKRWAILPPPSENFSEVTGQFAIKVDPARKFPARKVESHAAPAEAVSAETSVTSGKPAARRSAHTLPSMGISESDLEPSDSLRVTEVPPNSHERFIDRALETIPAPAWPDSED